MRIVSLLLTIIFSVSCGTNPVETGSKVITVSIAPYKYFVKEISGNDFAINVIVTPGSDPHIYEPFPEQISKLRRSSGYISNGYLGFESIWLERLYDANRNMKKLSLSDKINPLLSDHNDKDVHSEAVDPHYWSSPVCAMIMSLSVKEFLCELNPLQKERYEANYQSLLVKIQELDKIAKGLFSGLEKRSFMIFHPNLGYLARDYHLEEIPLEYEGKEPSPARLKELIDLARKEGLNTIFVQREYDTKNAQAIANEIGAEVKIIDPLGEDWLKSTTDIIDALYISLSKESK